MLLDINQSGNKGETDIGIELLVFTNMLATATTIATSEQNQNKTTIKNLSFDNE